jgi:predicted  nucleic acid-binding Zn-ribbon protein
MKECRSKAQALRKKLDSSQEENTLLQAKNEDLVEVNAELKRNEKDMYARNQELIGRLEHAQKINQVLHERMAQTSTDLNTRLSETYTNLKSTSTQVRWARKSLVKL